jgi:8-oxo-dGTP pyrophosphatase MutT (NUDIX family)
MKLDNPYRLTSRKEIYSNPWIRVREDHVIRPNGTAGMFGVVEVKPGASVLAMEGDGSVYLIKEYKYGVGRESVEVMSGGIEEGETPLDTARRELREELGLTAREYTDLGMIDPFTTAAQSPNYLFLARGLERCESEPDEGEFLEIVRVPFARAVEMAMASEITHAASCAVILKARVWLGR